MRSLALTIASALLVSKTAALLNELAAVAAALLSSCGKGGSVPGVIKDFGGALHCPSVVIPAINVGPCRLPELALGNPRAVPELALGVFICALSVGTPLKTGAAALAAETCISRPAWLGLGVNNIPPVFCISGGFPEERDLRAQLGNKLPDLAIGNLGSWGP